AGEHEGGAPDRDVEGGGGGAGEAAAGGGQGVAGPRLVDRQVGERGHPVDRRHGRRAAEGAARRVRADGQSYVGVGADLVVAGVEQLGRARRGHGPGRAGGGSELEGGQEGGAPDRDVEGGGGGAGEAGAGGGQGVAGPRPVDRQVAERGHPVDGGHGGRAAE